MQNSPTRAEIVRTALSFIGTPWRHQGRSRTGCDCIGLVAAIADELGALPADFEVPAYRRQPTAELLNYFDRYMTRIATTAVKEGSVAIFSFYGTPHHAGIIVNSSATDIVHAFATRKKVVADYLENGANGRRFIRAYDYRGVIDG